MTLARYLHVTITPLFHRFAISRRHSLSLRLDLHVIEDDVICGNHRLSLVLTAIGTKLLISESWTHLSVALLFVVVM